MIDHALFQHAFDGMLVVNAERICIDANPAAAAILGRRREALVGCPVDDLLAPQATDALAAPAGPLFQAGTITGETVIQRPDGTKRRIEYTTTSDRETRHHIAIFRDRTEHHQAVAALEATSRRLAEAEATAHLGHWECTPADDEVHWSDELIPKTRLRSGTFMSGVDEAKFCRRSPIGSFGPTGPSATCAAAATPSPTAGAS
jgi:PAS domain S-box-containing protein